MKTNNKPIDKHTRSAVHLPRGALKKSKDTMKKITVRNLLAVFVSLAMVQALAASASIGIATAKGSFRVDDSYVAGNATLFDGAAVETGPDTGVLNLSKTKVVMATETRGRVFQDHLVLDRGKVQWSGSTFRTVAGDFQIVGVDTSSKALVERRGETVQVASLSGTVNVLSTSGESLMSVAAGTAFDFTPEPQGASPGEKKDPDGSAKNNKNTKKKAAGMAVAMSVGTKVAIVAVAVGAGGATAGVLAIRSDSSTATTSR